MAYNNGREDRKWRIWKEAEEKVLREHGVDEATIEQIRIDDRADFNSNRRFYHWAISFVEYPFIFSRTICSVRLSIENTKKFVQNLDSHIAAMVF